MFNYLKSTRNNWGESFKYSPCGYIGDGKSFKCPPFVGKEYVN
jgi:hypothetical protein